MRAILQRGNSPETAVRIGLGQSGPRPDKYRFALELSDCIVQIVMQSYMSVCVIA